MNDPTRLALDIMELRAYARAKEAVKNAKSKADIPDSLMVQKVFEVEAELLTRRKEEGTCQE